MDSKDHPLIEFSLWLDLISLSMRAGLDFKSALILITENESSSKVGKGFQRLLSELRIGKSREEAIGKLLETWNHPLIGQFCQTLLYGLKQGISIADLLKGQAENIRDQFFLEFEKTAQRKPFKLLIPLFLLILPATMIVLMLPIFLQLFQDGF
jgi:tight adherence protein C